MRCPLNGAITARAADVVGAASAASTIAVSGSTRPGARSRRRAIASRASQSARTTASWRRRRTRCRPEVRRHGSIRGSGAGGGRDRRELLPRPLGLALLDQDGVQRVAQLDQHLDVQRGVPQPGRGQRTGGPVGGSVPLLQGQPEHLLDQRAQPDPRVAGEPAGQLGVEQPASAACRSPRGRAGPGWPRAGPTPRRRARRRGCSGPGSRPGRPARCRRRPGAAGPGRRAGRTGSRRPARRRRRPVRSLRRSPPRSWPASSGRRPRRGRRRAARAGVRRPGPRARSGAPAGPRPRQFPVTRSP